MIEQGIELLGRIRAQHRRTLAFIAYGCITALAYTAAFFIRFDFVWPAEYNEVFLLTLPLLLVLRQVIALLFRLTTSRWRFVGVHDVLRLMMAVTTGTLLFLIATFFVPITPRIPISVVALEGVLSVALTAALWLGYRMSFEALRHRRGMHGTPGHRVLILGAGESGYMLAREMLRSEGGYRPVGFVDDDPYKGGTRLAGLQVLGTTDRLAEISQTVRADELILAVPEATPAELWVLVERCAATGLPYRVLPSIAEVLAGEIRVEQLREVRIEDLLGRDPVQLDLLELAHDLRGGCALVTGAAGSIGSELSRQIARHSPATLLLLDQAETELFFLEMELRERHPELRIIPLIRDVVEASAVETIFHAYRPTHVFHAAAYKHVPLMESNPREAVRNNVLGSQVIAEAAGRHGARKFVLVSTDKAVRPRSVMGASKRLAELATLELQERYPDTAFAAVRFGNVLGSNGSVIPIFKRQLAAGTPLTVTDERATRYFMTIPEAVQLILQASLLPEIRGHVAMLEMGEPVRIIDLARNLLRLSGVHNPDRIVFTGLRPGEKLHEELVSEDEETIETSIPKVRLVRSNSTEPWPFLARLGDLRHAVEAGREGDIDALLRELFPERLREKGRRTVLIAGRVGNRE